MEKTETGRKLKGVFLMRRYLWERKYKMKIISIKIIILLFFIKIKEEKVTKVAGGGTFSWSFPEWYRNYYIKFSENSDFPFGFISKNTSNFYLKLLLLF